MPKDTVWMRSPSSEVREVEPKPEVLTPLMAAGWIQILITPGEPVSAPAAPAAPGEGK